MLAVIEIDRHSLIPIPTILSNRTHNLEALEDKQLTLAQAEVEIVRKVLIPTIPNNGTHNVEAPGDEQLMLVQAEGQILVVEAIQEVGVVACPDSGIKMIQMVPSQAETLVNGQTDSAM